MNIIFLWDQDINSDNTGVILSGKYFTSYNRETDELCITRNDHYVEGFWGKQVRDCFAVVGKNGSGKTRLANILMEDICVIKAQDFDRRKQFFLIVEKEDRGVLHIYYTENFSKLYINQQDEITYEIQMHPVEDLKKSYLKECEVAYFHAPLSYYDYFKDSRCRYDFSLGHMIRHHRDITYEMHYDSLGKDVIRNYYANEIFRILPFLYDDAAKNMEIDFFKKLKNIRIRVVDSEHNEKHLRDETKKLPVYKEEGVTDHIIEGFIHNVNNLEKISEKNWINATVKHLILNCYKELCIPDTVPADNRESPRLFFNACNFLENVESLESSIYDCVFRITKHLRQNIQYHIYSQYIDHVEEFVEWLKSKEKQIDSMASYLQRQLDVPVNDDTKPFIHRLATLYSKMNFAFPFYEFHFGVSTGEFDYLSLFSNLHSMVNDNSRMNPYDYPPLESDKKSLLLIFDEADLSMHPRWQIEYLKLLTDFCEQLFTNLSVKIIITTHSPILLSDFPADSILYLTGDGEKQTTYSQSGRKTFGSNIHSLYLNAFFLEDYGTMGAFAQEKINDLADKLLQAPAAEIDVERAEKIIDCLGEGIIRDKLEEALYSKKGKEQNVPLTESENIIISDTLARLKEQRNNMDQLIKILEEKTDDKNRH